MPRTKAATMPTQNSLRKNFVPAVSFVRAVEHPNAFSNVPAQQ
jgi:hypothetical protein